MEFYACFEDSHTQYAEGYENKRYAEEYAEEAKNNGYINVRVLSKEEYAEEWALELD